MSRKAIIILPLATALASLIGAPGENTASKAATPTQSATPENRLASAVTPNSFAVAGQDLLGFLVTEQADGTLIAQHVSHASHASHRSHASHYSSR
jgi:hypothetical protein